jgi:DNA gyrase subunit B
VLTVLHAGGKFGGGGYAVSGGLHGVGSSVVNALSTRFEVEIRRQGFVWRQSSPTAASRRAARAGETTDETGTVITFWPDATIFETVEFDYDTLRTRFQQTAFLNKGLRITLRDLRPPRRTSSTAKTAAVEKQPLDDFHYERGLVDYVEYLNKMRKAEVVNDEIIEVESEDTERHISLELAMQWTTSYTENVFTFANTINTHEGGTHEEGFRAALTTLINKYARANNLLKEKDDNLTGDDIREGLTAVISVKLSEPQFEGRPRPSSATPRRRRSCRRSSATSSPTGSTATRRRPSASSRRRSMPRPRAAARKARETARRKSVFESAPCPTSSRTARARTRRSARSSSSRATRPAARPCRPRPRAQAILSLRGKILNVEKAPGPALGNNEIQAMISAFGTGIGEDFDVEKARYHKIVLMADADVDGQHITTLLLTLLFRYMRGLIEAGFVYLAMPPLYRLKWSNSPHEYVYSDRERDALLADGSPRASASRRTTASSATRVSAR